VSDDLSGNENRNAMMSESENDGENRVYLNL
jgi:hypothetical protein